MSGRPNDIYRQTVFTTNFSTMKHVRFAALFCFFQLVSSSVVFTSCQKEAISPAAPEAMASVSLQSDATTCSGLEDYDNIVPRVSALMQQQANDNCLTMRRCISCCLDGEPIYITLAVQPNNGCTQPVDADTNDQDF
jgi:hypothetical protein